MILFCQYRRGLFILSIVLQVVFRDFCTASIIPGFHYYETITNVDRQSRFKRSLDVGVDATEFVSFRAFNRSFEMILKPGTDILSSDFKANVVHANGLTSRLYVNVNDHLTGHLVDDPSVFVDGYKDDDMISLTIFDDMDIYALEPARDYKVADTDDAARDKTWIAYRMSDTYLGVRGIGMDMRQLVNSSFCGVKDDAIKPANQKYSHTKNPSSGQQRKRHVSFYSFSQGKRNTCVVALVATYDFFVTSCTKSKYRCAQVLLCSVAFIDLSFRSLELGVDPGVRFVLRQITIHTKESSIKQHYNYNKAVWIADDLLSSFTKLSRDFNSAFCMTFLFSCHNIYKSVVGLAWKGGVCSNSNTGIATCIEQGIVISRISMRMLFLHGHLVGSSHDIDKPPCTESYRNGGPYVMWHRTTNGICGNCRTFSPCSVKEIKAFLAGSYSRSCFEDYRSARKMCGNGIIDKGEQCDDGFYSSLTNCCNDKCQLIGDAHCSDHSHSCCRNCQKAPKGFLCLGHIDGSCMNSSYCTGDSLECPEPDVLEENTPCRDYGFCSNGVCQDFCQHLATRSQRNYMPCLCDQDELSGCKICCYDGTDPKKPGPCQVRSDYNLSDGRPCYLGFCRDKRMLKEDEESWYGRNPNSHKRVIQLAPAGKMITRQSKYYMVDRASGRARKNRSTRKSTAKSDLHRSRQQNKKNEQKGLKSQQKSLQSEHKSVKSELEGLESKQKSVKMTDLDAESCVDGPHQDSLMTFHVDSETRL